MGRGIFRLRFGRGATQLGFVDVLCGLQESSGGSRE